MATLNLQGILGNSYHMTRKKVKKICIWGQQLCYMPQLRWCEWERICLPLQKTQEIEPGFKPWVGKIPWRRKWQPTPVFLPGKFLEQRSLVGYSPRVTKVKSMYTHNFAIWCCSTGHSHCLQGLCSLMRIKWKPRAFTHYCFHSFDFTSLDLHILNMFPKKLGFLSILVAISHPVIPCNTVI